MSAIFSPVSVSPMSMIKSSLADASNRPSWLNDIVRTGQSKRENTLKQANSFASHNETRASAEPVAKYLPNF